MKLVDNRNGIEVYDLENGYRVAKEPCSWISRGYILRIYAALDSKYLPNIYDYVDCADEKSEFAFRIKTTSYGSMPPDEIQKMISGFQTALETIQIIEETFKEKNESQ